MKPNKLIPLLLLLLLPLLLLAGCSDDDPATPDPNDGWEPDPINPMLDFEAAYGQMSIDDLTRLLHPAFEMIPQTETRDAWGWDADFTLDHSAFVLAHTHLFGGEPGSDPVGNAVHPIAAVEIDLMEQRTAFVAVPPDDAYFGDFADAKWATFSLVIQFHDEDRSHQFEILQQAVVYWAPDEDSGGGMRLLGIRVLTPEKSTDPTGWDYLISFYL